MGRKVYLNGKFVDKNKAKISVFDHGLLYGDGAFEGIRSYDSRVFKLQEHIDRLYKSAFAMKLKIHMTKSAMMKTVIKTLKKNKLKNAYIRLVITRGPGDLGLDPRKCKKGGSIFIITDTIALYPKKFYEKGLNIITADVHKNHIFAIDPNIKSLNYLNNILAKLDAIAKNCPEAIMLTHEGYVSECTGDNIFIVKNGKLTTPPRSISLEGITQGVVIEIAKKLKISAEEKNMVLKDVYNADECFLTGTAAEIIPVKKVDKHKIGNGKPGPITLKLSAKFKELTKKDGIKY